jgi:hypothetical protein
MLIHSKSLFEALVKAGVVREDEQIRRIVVDAQAGSAVRIYVDRFGDERLLQVVPTLDGIEISSVPAPPPLVADEDLVEHYGREDTA